MSKEGSFRKPRKVTMQEVAAALGIGVTSVSNAYNRPDQLSAQLREKIFDKARELGYTGPDALARSLRQQRVGAIGVLFAEHLSYAFSDQAALEMLNGVAIELNEEQLGMLLVPGRGEDFTSMVQGALVDGFIVYSMHENDPLVTTVLARGLPTVLMDHPPGLGVHSINIDDEGGARQAAELLLQLGHRRFAVITDRLSEEVAGSLIAMPEIEQIPFYVARLRLKGYREALEKSGIEWKGVALYECIDNREADGAVAMRALLACSPSPTAVLCLTDRLAIGALTALKQAGLGVPGDISIVGFDDIGLASQIEPALTTVRQDHREKGQRAAQMLIAMLRSEVVPDKEILPIRLIVRGTTGSASNYSG